MKKLWARVEPGIVRFSRKAVRVIGPVILDVSGLAFISAAAWVIALPLGLVISGLACFVLQWRLRG